MGKLIDILNKKQRPVSLKAAKVIDNEKQKEVIEAQKTVVNENEDHKNTKRINHYRIY